MGKTTVTTSTNPTHISQLQPGIRGSHLDILVITAKAAGHVLTRLRDRDGRARDGGGGEGHNGDNSGEDAEVHCAVFF